MDNAPNLPCKFRTKNWVKINNDLRGRYNTNSQIKFETSMLRSSLYDFSDPYILLNELQQSQTLQPQLLTQIIEIRK